MKKKQADAGSGKKLRTQVFILTRLLSVMESIDYCFLALKADGVRWEAFGKVIEIEESYLKRSETEGEETGRRTALLRYGIHDLTCNLAELRDEYAGLKMDFSKYKDRLSALWQLRLVIRKLAPPRPVGDWEAGRG